MKSPKAFSKKDIEAVEAIYQREKKLALPVTPAWIKKAHALKGSLRKGYEEMSQLSRQTCREFSQLDEESLRYVD